MSKIQNEALEWVVRQSSRPLTAEEQAAFAAWFDAHPSHPGAYLRARAIERALEKLTPEESIRPSQEAVHHGWDAALFRRAHGRRRFLAGAAVAAGVAAVTAGIALPRFFDQTTLQTAKGEFRKVPLADKSIVSINGASRVQVKLGELERRVALIQGEAWFNVAKDKTKPFVVEAGDILVRAVGTAFSVRRYGNGADVVVTEGVVEVWTGHGTATKTRLTAGQHAFVPDRAASIVARRAPDEVERRLAWREGRLVFRDQSLSEAVAEFNRYNTRTLVIGDPDLRHKKFIGQYRVDEPERFADDVQSLLGVPVFVHTDSIQIGRARR